MVVAELLGAGHGHGVARQRLVDGAPLAARAGRDGGDEQRERGPGRDGTNRHRGRVPASEGAETSAPAAGACEAPVFRARGRRRRARDPGPQAIRIPGRNNHDRRLPSAAEVRNARRSPCSKPPRPTAESAPRARRRRRRRPGGISASLLGYLMGPAALALILVLRAYGLVADEPTWLWIAVFVVVPTTSVLADLAYRQRPSTARLHDAHRGALRRGHAS